MQFQSSSWADRARFIVWRVYDWVCAWGHTQESTPGRCSCCYRDE